MIVTLNVDVETCLTRVQPSNSTRFHTPALRCSQCMRNLRFPHSPLCSVCTMVSASGKNQLRSSRLVPSSSGKRVGKPDPPHRRALDGWTKGYVGFTDMLMARLDGVDGIIAWMLPSPSISLTHERNQAISSLRGMILRGQHLLRPIRQQASRPDPRLYRSPEFNFPPLYGGGVEPYATRETTLVRTCALPLFVSTLY